jgi:hypothetical protein
LGGAVLTLFDTRLILLVGALLSTWAAYRMRVWRWTEAHAPGSVANQ